jgi:LCP family protein required for cell wall assembly
MGKKIGWLAGKFVTAACAVLTEIFIYLLGTTKLLPFKFLAIGGGALAVLVILVAVLTWNTKRMSRYVIGWILALLMGFVLVTGCRYIIRTNQTTGQMTSTRVETTEMGIYVRIDDPNDFSSVAASYTYGILSQLDRDNTDIALEKLEDELGTTVTTVEYDSITDLADALLSEDTDAILVNKGFIEMLEEMDGYEDIMSRIREATLLVTEKVVEVAVPDAVTPEDTSGDAQASSNSFSIYLSGIDTYGSISTKSRSDVNIIATVNTETHQILLVSTPRDYFIPLSISNGKEDKLTHAGIYGIQVSMDTLEMLYDTDIDYYFRVNFSGFQKIIDALGGITVDSDYSFTSQDGYSYSKGENTLDGARALSFARERHAFAEGDNQRGKNQMAVIKGVIKKAMSPELLMNYTSVLDAVDGNFETSMSYDLLASLVRDQLNTGSSWEVITYSATGEGSSAVPYSMSQTAYVMIPDMDSVETAKELMASVRAGKVITQP